MTARERRRLSALHVYERTAWESGAQLVCGVDEVGRGPLAGPVTACAVVLAQPLLLEFLNDSKLVTPLRRAVLAAQIRAGAAWVAVGWATAEEIDSLNILGATRLAMARAIEQLPVAPCRVLVDAVHIPQCASPQTAIIGGDGKSAAIAAASIVAKVARDEYMEALDAEHPGYGFRTTAATPPRSISQRSTGWAVRRASPVVRTRHAAVVVRAGRVASYEESRPRRLQRRHGRRSGRRALSHERGYHVLERNFRCRGGEIDLIALDGGTPVFIESEAAADARAERP